MSNPLSFINSYSQNIVTLINMLKALETQNAMLTDDPTIITRYFALPPVGAVPRNDIVAADVEAAQAALVQVLFAFNSGDPTQASALYKMMP